MEKAVVLLSGGVDSSVCLAKTVREFGAENVIALNVFYGQRHVKEMSCAVKQAAYQGVELKYLDLSAVFGFNPECSLLAKSEEAVPDKSYAEQLAEMGGEGTVTTYIPFRNGLFLSAAASVALQCGASYLVYGAHADDAAGRAYPDCTEEFVAAQRLAIYEGSGRILHLQAPLIDLNKTQVVSMGLSLGVHFEDTWSCYKGKEISCGTCGTCIDRKNAFEQCGVTDPITYA